MPRTITFTSAAMPSLMGTSALELRRVSGSESLGHLFEYRLELVTPDSRFITEPMAANVPFKDLVGKEGSVLIELDGGGIREINALITAARFVRVENRRGVYEVLMEPWLTLATRTSDHKIFQNLAVNEILQQVLADYPFPSRLGLMHAYPKREFQVQYGETDLVFIERLMQEWGLYYFFEHSGGVHRLVIVDDPACHVPNPGSYAAVSYYPPGHKIDEEYVSDFTLHQGLQPGKWVTSDFDFKKPRADLKQTVALPRKTGQPDFEHFRWPGDYVVGTEGKDLARVRMEREGSPGQRAAGSGNLRGMVTGCTFSLSLHPQDAANIDYLILASQLDISEVGAASGQGQYHCHVQFEVQPAANIYRSEQRQAKPHTHGPQTATVTGPAGREIYTDEYGRVKLSFHWNRYCTKDQNSSCWIRVSSPWAGSNFGGIQIPRIGQEVIVDFENGDPDKPLITGRVYNGLNMPPWELPANMTQSGMLTRSSEGGGPANANALRFEDKMGQEEVWLHAEKDQRIEVEHDESHWVGHDRSKTIDHDETNHIKNDRTETVDGHEKITVHKTRTEEVDGDETLTVHSNRTRQVDGHEKESIGKTKVETIALAHMQTIGLAKMVNIGAAYNLNVGGLMATVVGMQRSDVTALDHSDQVGKNRSTTVAKNYTIEAGETFSVKVGQSVLVMKSDGTITIDGAKFQLTAPDKINIFSEDIDLN